jgi:release factor glutamine methyltransferase
MNLSTLWAWGQGELAGAGLADARFEAELLLRKVLDLDRARFLTSPNHMVPAEQQERYRKLIRKRSLGTPTQYLLGTQEFYGRVFIVTPAVLIPRPETELLVEEVLDRFKSCQPPAASRQPNMLAEEGNTCGSESSQWNVAQRGQHRTETSSRGLGALCLLDLCTGSGCIGLTLAAELPGAHVVLADISEGALDVAGENTRRLGLASRVERIQGDLFAALAGHRFHCIVSNPPYIPTEDISSLSPEVRREPHRALDGGPDGLAFYRRIAAESPSFLFPGGLLAVEIGDGQGSSVMSLLEDNGFTDITLKTDLAGRERVVVGCWQGS